MYSPGHVRPTGNVWPEDLHLLVEAVVEDQGVGHGQPMGLHGVQEPVVEVAHIWVVEICHLWPGVASTHSG